MTAQYSTEHMYHDPTHSLIWVHLDSSLCYYSWYCIDSHWTGLCAYILERSKLLTSCCCCWVAQLCPTLCNPMGCSTPGLPVLHHHPKFAHVHLHCISDAIQPAHPLTLSSPSALAHVPSLAGRFLSVAPPWKFCFSFWCEDKSLLFVFVEKSSCGVA